MPIKKEKETAEEGKEVWQRERLVSIQVITKIASMDTLGPMFSEVAIDFFIFTIFSKKYATSEIILPRCVEFL